MDLRLDKRIVAERVMSFTAENYLYFWGLMKGIALGIAAVVVMTFFDEPSTLVPRFILWFAGIAALMVSHATTARGVLLTNFRYNLFDGLLPLAMGTLECLLFTVLQPNEKSPDLWWKSWYWLLAGHAALAVGLIRNRLLLHESADFDVELQPLAFRYTEWLRRDARAATFFALSTAVFALLLNQQLISYWQHAMWWDSVAGLIIIAILAKVSVDAESQRREVVHLLHGLPE